jgi:hypothetical protein
MNETTASERVKSVSEFSFNEAEAMDGLAIKHYHFKWKSAKVMAGNHHQDFPYWARVRILYLELGGLYIHQLNPRQQALYFKGAFNA